LLRLVAFVSKMPHLSAVEAQKVAGRRLLWWPGCSLLRRWSRSTVELLLLLWLLLLQLELPLFVLWAVVLILLLLGSTQLSRRWGIQHAVLGRSTARPTSAGGSWHCPLSLLFLSLSNGLHCPLVINGGTRQVIVGQVGGLYQVVLQLDGKPIVIEVGFLLICIYVI
jgi:hypothetical protein